jgi:hypothetical protein
MVTDSKSGQTVPSTKETGRMIKLTVMVSLSTLMGTFTKVNGKMIKLMEMVTTLMQMVQLTVVNGKMISNMAKVLRPGQMELSTRDSTLRARNTIRVL